MAIRNEELRLAAGTLNLTVTEEGSGPAYLLLHGGAGPASMAALSARLGGHGLAVTPTHPGFNGQPRPEWFSRPGDLVEAYLALLDRLTLTRVVVVGNSFGGWIAAALALRGGPRVAGVVLLNPVGLEPGPGQGIADPTKVPPAERTALSFHDPRKGFGVPNEAQLAMMAENQKTLRVYAGASLFSQTLRAEVAALRAPTLVAWGESDKIVDVAYGKLWVESIPGARFHAVPEAGHFPQIEQPDEVAALITGFAAQL